MMRAQNRSAEKHRKNQGKLEGPKGVFLEGRWRRAKWDNGVEQGDRREVKKFFMGAEFGVVELVDFFRRTNF